MASFLMFGLVLAGSFFGLHAMIRRHGSERLYRRVTIIVAAIIIAIAWALFAATQLGFIQDHAP